MRASFCTKLKLGMVFQGTGKWVGSNTPWSLEMDTAVIGGAQNRSEFSCFLLKCRALSPWRLVFYGGHNWWNWFGLLTRISHSKWLVPSKIMTVSVRHCVCAGSIISWSNISCSSPNSFRCLWWSMDRWFDCGMRIMGGRCHGLSSVLVKLMMNI